MLDQKHFPVESHGRTETEALVDGLEILMPREFQYYGTAQRELIWKARSPTA